MNNDITVFYQDNDSLIIGWDKSNDVSFYSIMVMDNVFVWRRLRTTKTNFATIDKKDLEKYLCIRVNYVLCSEELKKEIVLGETNFLALNKDTYTSLEVKSINSYKGITFSFQSEEIYDKYCVYEKDGDDYVLLLECEDFVVNSPLFKEDKEYVVEGYKKYGNHYKLLAKSDLYKCKPIKLKNSKDKHLSIIMPVFNGEIFIQRTIDSILFSTFNDYELIIINDGSKDSSVEIIDWYQKKYKSRIKVFSQENQGLSFARNVGIKLASCEYIAFIDNDDLVHPYMYERLYNSAVKNDLDVAIAKTLIRNDIDKHDICLRAGSHLSDDTIIYSFDRMFIEKTNCTKENIYFCAVWNKIMKTKYVKEHPFPLNNRYEDTAFTMNVYTYLDRFGFVKNAYYVWDKRFQKTVGTFSNTYFKVVNPQAMKKAYYDAIMYPLTHGNMERLDYIAYYCVEEIYNRLDKAKPFASNDVIGYYKMHIIKTHIKANLLENPYIIHHKKYLDFVKSVINKKST